MPIPLIIAHRGASAVAPENTLAAFKKALDVGADGVEFDVRLSKDGVPVVIHDETLLRTAGINKRVAELTAEQLSRVDAGSWFNAAYPRHSKPAFASEVVSSLRTVLQLLKGIDGPIYIELKREIDEDSTPLVEAVCHEIANSRLAEKVIVQSFHLAVVAQTRACLPGVRTAALFAPKLMRILRKEKYLIDIAREFGADQLSLHKALVSRRLLRKTEKEGLPVTVWTVDTTRWISRATRLGLYAVITNDPSKLLLAMPQGRAQGEIEGSSLDNSPPTE
ncbi:MAG: hypothetical protein H0U23_13610 [Blastocatellia bacterium]|nr:hypothetical protein [Blastocatellia bacterium]